MNDKISDKDKADWENFIKSKEKLADKDYKKTVINYTTKSIDLHGYTLEQANQTIEKFITKSFHENIKKLVVLQEKVFIQIMKEPICIKRSQYFKIFCSRVYFK